MRVKMLNIKLISCLALFKYFPYQNLIHNKNCCFSKILGTEEVE